MPLTSQNKQKITPIGKMKMFREMKKNDEEEERIIYGNDCYRMTKLFCLYIFFPYGFSIQST